MLQSLKNVCHFCCSDPIISGQITGYLGACAIVKYKIINLNPLAATVSYVAHRKLSSCLNSFFLPYGDRKVNDVISKSLGLISAASTYALISKFTQRNLIRINLALFLFAILANQTKKIEGIKK